MVQHALPYPSHTIERQQKAENHSSFASKAANRFFISILFHYLLYVLFFTPFNATANLMTSQYHAHLDQQIMISLFCAAFPHLLIRPGMRKMGV